MAKPKFRSFTIRVPEDTYLQMAEAAQSDEVPLNHKANQLISLGLGKHISLDAAVRRLLMKEATTDVATA